MYHSEQDSSLESYLWSIHSESRQDRVSARLYEDISKSLFLSSGDSDLQILHATYEEKPCPTEPVSVTPDALSGKTAIQPDTACSTDEGARSTNGYACEIPVVHSLDGLRSLREVQSRLRGYLISQDNSRARLKITQSLYDALCVREAIPDIFKDTIMYMGFRRYDFEISPPAPKWRHLQLSPISPDSRGWQCSFMLRYPARNHRTGDWPWSLRQFATYSRCNTRSDSCVYVFVAPPAEVLEDFREVSSQDNLDAVALHTALKIKILQTVIAHWRPFSVWIAQELAKINVQITFKNPLRQQLANLAYDGTGERLRGFEDLIDGAIVSLKANKCVLSVLLQMWRSSEVLNEKFTYLDALMDELNTCLDGHVLQFQNLQQKAKNYAQTVSRYQTLNHDLCLENLATETRKDSEATVELSRQSQADAEAVKALTFVALVFLPVSVVLSFFSTSLYESSDNGIKLKPRWWLFLAIGIPLTIFTLLSWMAYVLLKRKFKGSRFDWKRLSWHQNRLKADTATTHIKMSSLSGASV